MSKFIHRTIHIEKEGTLVHTKAWVIEKPDGTIRIIPRGETEPCACKNMTVEVYRRKEDVAT